MTCDSKINLYTFRCYVKATWNVHFYLNFIATFLIDDFLKFQIWVIGAFTRYHIFSNFYTSMHLQRRYVEWPSINSQAFLWFFIFLTFSWYDYILIRLSDGKRTPTYFETTLWFNLCVYMIQFLSNVCWKEKSDGKSYRANAAWIHFSIY
jgi:hypothetical protein